MNLLKSSTLTALFLTISLITSCSNDEDLEIQPKFLTLKFENAGNANARSDSSFSLYTAEIISMSPLVIKSNDLIVVGAVNSETGLKSFVITRKKDGTVDKKGSKSSSALRLDAGIEQGYWYDGDDCFIYGTIITADDGTRLFIPADAATQYLMNDCGYRYMA